MAEVKITLSAAELVYLVQENGGTLLPGISDPYQNLNDVDRENLLIGVENSLRKQGYRNRAFGGKTRFDPSLLKMIENCVHFQRYIGFDYRKRQSRPTTERFYGYQGQWLQISGYSDALTLSFQPAAQVKACLCGLPEDTGSKSSQIALLLPQTDFKVISQLAKSGKTDEVQSRIEGLNADAFNKQFLIDSLSFLTDYIAITIVSRDSGDIAAQSVAALIQTDAMAEFYQTVEDDRTMIGLRAASTGSWNTLKNIAVQWLAEG